MKASKLLLFALIIILVVPMSGCNLIGQNPLSALGSLVPEATAEDTVEAAVEATVETGEATAESTPLIRPKTAAPTVRPKATTAKTAAATVKPKATVKATATKKATIAPTEAPTADHSPELPVGALLLSDDFSDPESGWAVDVGDTSEMGYQDGKYVITVLNENWLAWTFTDQTFTDFVVEIEAAKVSGPNDGEYGIQFRYIDNTNYYIFEVSASGSYIVSVLLDGEWENLIPWTKNSVIKTGTNSNKLAVVAQGETFSFYINGVMVDEVVDSTFTEGSIAMVAGTRTTGGFVVEFTSIGIWEVGESVSPTSEPSSGISKGAKLYSETFADASTGWDEWDGSKSRGGYEGGKYFIEVLDTDNFAWGNGYQSFDDFVIEVDATKAAGLDDNAFGIILRYVDVDNFYVFAASSDGQYRFGYYLDNTLTDIISWTASDAINQGAATNKLSVACKGNHFILSINGTVVEEFTDDTFSSGDIGLLAYAGAEAGVMITYDNLGVWAVK